MRRECKETLSQRVCLLFSTTTESSRPSKENPSQETGAAKIRTSRSCALRAICSEQWQDVVVVQEGNVSAVQGAEKQDTTR